RTYEQALKANSISKVVVATDDERIFEHVKSFGGYVVMTSTENHSGSDRCNEAVQIILKENNTIKYDVVINVQGDEPYIKPEQINLLTDCFKNVETEIATLVKRIISTQDLFSANIAKVLINNNNEAICFSRQAIPHIRQFPENEWLSHFSFYKHIGIYGYRTNVLEKITRLAPSPIENAEALEQMRWIENGYKIKVAETEFDSKAVDTPDDLKKLLTMPE
ncbi:MAG: 3-deoxy-D-manno-octulosonate cytidylyltransferase, partial [Bacteroidetes bacterium RIFCSPLOWO2_12_FULL_31_6]